MLKLRINSTHSARRFVRATAALAVASGVVVTGAHSASATHLTQAAGSVVKPPPRSPEKPSAASKGKPSAASKEKHTSHSDDGMTDNKTHADNATDGNTGDGTKATATHGDNATDTTPGGTGDNKSTEGSMDSMGSMAPPPASKPAPAPAPASASADPVSGAVNPFMAHLQAAHFNRGPGQQVQDIAELDDWSKTHEALVRQMLDYEVGPSSAAGTAPVASTFMQHMDNAHWNRSPVGQANDIANFDSWNKSHLALIRMMLDPVVGRSSALGTAPGTSVFMQHLDAAHWNQSVNGQVTAITDDLPGWTASHAAMLQAMGASAASGGSGH